MLPVGLRRARLGNDNSEITVMGCRLEKILHGD